MAIEGVSATGLEAQLSQTDAVKSLIRWESPHPLSIAGVTETAGWRFSVDSSGRGELDCSVILVPCPRTMPESEFLFRCYSDPNKGERSHALSRFLFFGKEGAARGRSFQDQVNTFSCLAVLHN